MGKKTIAVRQSPQAREKCCCPSWTTRRECMAIRYSSEEGETCECCCHEKDDDDF